jgi:plastocyanin
VGPRVARIARVVALLVGALVLGAAPASAGGGGHCDDPLAEGTGTDVEMFDACFTPAVLHARTGEDITFTNLDHMAHNIAPAGWGWGHVDALLQGETYTTRFDEAGVYPFACSLHPGMTGAVIVTDGPTGDAGEPALLATDTVTDVGGPPVWWIAVVGVVGVGVGYAGATMRRRATRRGDAAEDPSA